MATPHRPDSIQMIASQKMVPLEHKPERADIEVRLCIVDDQPIFRESLVQLLGPYGHVNILGRCGIADGARHILSFGPTDVVLIHLDTDKRGVFALLTQLEQASFKGRIVVVTGPLTESDVIWLVCHGVWGILSKNDSHAQLVKCIGKVILGEFWLDQPLLRTIITASIPFLKKLHHESFSDRELVLMKGLAQGLTNKEIAARLGVDESAVKANFHRMFKKTGVRTRAQLLGVALARFGENFHQVL